MPHKKTPQKTDKNSEPKEYTKIANLFLDNLYLFASSERDAYLVVARKTIGNHIESNTISVSEVAKRLDIDRNTARKALDGLELKGWIECVGLGLRGAKNYKIVLLENINDLKPLKELPKRVDIDQKQMKRTKLKKSDLMKNSPGQKKLTCRKIHQEPDEKFTRSVPLDHYIKEKRTTTTSLPFSKIPKKLIDAFPSELRIKPILKITAEGLTGKGMPEREPEFIQTEIEWLLKYMETHEVKNLTGLYRTALIEGYGNDAKLLPEIQKPGTQDPQKILDQNLAEQIKLNKQRQEDEARIQLSENLQALIDSLPSDEYDRLKSIAIDSMSKGDKALYMRNHSKFTLNRCMRKVYDKLYEKV